MASRGGDNLRPRQGPVMSGGHTARVPAAVGAEFLNLYR